MRDEGYCKYQCELTEEEILLPTDPTPFFQVRRALWKYGYIGQYDDGIGFGNLSFRSAPASFFISATATGGKDRLSEDDIVEVMECDPYRNRVRARGKASPSSEAMTHWAIYEKCPACFAVIHVHSADLFSYLRKKSYPATGAAVSYGTPAMAENISAVVDQSREGGVFYTPGHSEGVFAYGRDLLSTFQKLKHLRMECCNE
ncbi:class II aldolase/adducin family protein [Chitinivibrio alkaliphilus]|uniref:Class II aldolase/adducin family protein n=1 Tax=Chitinivibrio alkaliphilus ACht1 TaxID=1313304 RepID=U7DAE6_9BACT|nr:class II aldolase/adducin family protein [Chitinivibrio alkaliphilus]ERP31365.1 class II aldolase/adducin family protein [Chitinivibrio alkaliphilus ACht1]